MSLDAILDCVVIPNPCDWESPPRHTRAWKTDVVAGLSGAEDRASLRTKPVRKLECNILAVGVPERALLTERLKAALKAGRAAAPLWGRSQSVPDGLVVENNIVLDAGYPWAAGDYMFFRLLGDHAENNHQGVNCGSGSASDDFMPDGYFSIGYGERMSTASPVVVTGLRLTPPPQTVLRSARTWRNPATPAYYVAYSVGDLDPARTYRLVLWFAGIESYLAAADPADLKFTIQIAGATTQSVTDYAPLVAADGVLKATFLAFDVKPNANGRIDITLTPTGYSNAPCGNDVIGRWCSINAIEIYDTRWQIMKISTVSNDGDYVGLEFDADSTISERDQVKEVWPVILGTPKVGDLESITSEHGSVKLTVQEPPGSGVKEPNPQCQLEICGTPTGGAIIPSQYEWTAYYSAYGFPYVTGNFPQDFMSGWGTLWEFWRTLWQAELAIYMRDSHPNGEIIFQEEAYSKDEYVHGPCWAVTAKWGSGFGTPDPTVDLPPNNPQPYSVPWVSHDGYLGRLGCRMLIKKS